MRKIVLAPLLAASAAAGCSGSTQAGVTTPRVTTTPTPAPYVVPKRLPGEVARAVFGHVNRETAGEATPKPNVKYVVWAACVSNPGQRDTVRWEVRIARPKTNRVFEDGTMPCDGQKGFFGLSRLPRQPIQLALTWVGKAGPRAYGVIAPARD